MTRVSHSTLFVTVPCKAAITPTHQDWVAYWIAACRHRPVSRFRVPSLFYIWGKLPPSIGSQAATRINEGRQTRLRAFLAGLHWVPATPHPSWQPGGGARFKSKLRRAARGGAGLRRGREPSGLPRKRAARHGRCLAHAQTAAADPAGKCFSRSALDCAVATSRCRAGRRRGLSRSDWTGHQSIGCSASGLV